MHGAPHTWYDLSLRSWLTPLPDGAFTRLTTRAWRVPVSERTAAASLTVPYLPQRLATGRAGGGAWTLAGRTAWLALHVAVA